MLFFFFLDLVGVIFLDPSQTGKVRCVIVKERPML